MKDICPVKQTVDFLTRLIGPKGLPDPKGQRISEQTLVLAEEIAEGSAGDDHLPAIEALAKTYDDAGSPARTREAGRVIQGFLSDHREAFINHIQTRNCPTSDCSKLAPSPCQMACPAGIDIPTYLALIAQGKDDQAIEVIRRDNPLPWVCGLICTRPCEMMCVKAHVGALTQELHYLKDYISDLQDAAYD